LPSDTVIGSVAEVTGLPATSWTCTFTAGVMRAFHHRIGGLNTEDQFVGASDDTGRSENGRVSSNSRAGNGGSELVGPGTGPNVHDATAATPLPVRPYLRRRHGAAAVVT
jgi:hypothetical protein